MRDGREVGRVGFEHEVSGGHVARGFGDDAAQTAAVGHDDDFESELDGEIELRAEAGVQR